MRSPQKFKTQPGQPEAWQCEIRGKLETIYVPNEAEADYLTNASAKQQQECLEKIFNRQQHQIQQRQQRQQQQYATASSSTTNIASNATSNTTSNAASRSPQQSQVSEPTMTPTSLPPKHSSTPMDATTRRSEVVSPISVDQEVEDIKERTAKIREDLKDPIQKDEETEQPPMWQDSNDDQNATNDKIACKDRHHRFEQLTKSKLAAPAKKFYRAYNNFMIQLSKEEFGDTISREYGDKLLQAVYDTFDVVEEAREKCLEVLTTDDLAANPKYEQYMRDLLGKRCTCERMHQKYFEDQQRFEQHLQQQAQKQQDGSYKPLLQPTPIVPMPQYQYVP